jgi:GT2 family glycosyltransferase
VYIVSHFKDHGGLVDGGANGGIAGANCHVIETADQAKCYVNI